MTRDYTLIRSDRRTLALEVTREGTLVVRAPKRASQGDIDDAIRRHAQWLDRAVARQRERAAARPEPTAPERQALTVRAQALIPARVAHYSRLMGLEPAGVTITNAARRFGSCSAKNRLCFSWRLMLYPDAAIDYVVVHELAHIVHKNHGKDFYALVEAFLPDYRARRKLLKE